MKNTIKMLTGMALVLGIITIAFFAQPIQAYFHGDSKGNELQTRDRSRLRMNDCVGCGEALRQRNQSRETLRTNDCAYNCSNIQRQTQLRQGTAECTRSRSGTRK